MEAAGPCIRGIRQAPRGPGSLSARHRIRTTQRRQTGRARNAGLRTQTRAAARPRTRHGGLNLIDIDIWRTGLVARAVIATALAWCAAAGAVERGGDAYPTGLDLIERCNALNVQDSGGAEADPELQEDYGYCLGFLVGYVSGFAAREVGGEDSLFCPPES